MANAIGNMIAASCSFGLGYAERLLTDVTPDNFARFARPGGEVVRSNHPAFVFGHLSLYAPRVIQQLGGDLSEVKLPESFSCLFSKDATCQDDPDGTIYPGMEAIIDKYFAGFRAAESMLRDTPDAKFLEPNPDEGRLGELFPTVGAMLAFYVSGHMLVHLGQISAWRRMMGMRAA